MRTYVFLILMATMLFLCNSVNATFPPNPHYGHWVYLSGDITWTLNLIADNPNFIGIKKVYMWKDVETSEGVYDFSEIISDLAELQAEGKRLWIQLGYIRWGTSVGLPRTPTYQWSNSKYGGNSPYHGVYSRMGIPGATWAPIIWNSEVQARFEAVFAALGSQFNGEAYIEGTVLDETSVGAPILPGETEGYSPAAELAGFKVRVLAAKNAFPDKSVLQMINYSVNWDREAFGAWCLSNSIGIGCPDFAIKDRDLGPGQPFYTVIYPMMKNSHDDVPGGPDCQWANYEKTNPETGTDCTPLELLAAVYDLVDPYYFFWEKREPYFTDDVIPAVNQYPTLPITRPGSGPGVVDNGDAGTSSTGTWFVSSGPSPYGSSSLYCEDSGNTYTFEKSISGNYEISIWWTSLSRRPTSTTIKIYNGASLLDTKTVNQRVNGGQWNYLGAYDFTGTAKVKIESSAGSTVCTCADAVKFTSTSGAVIPTLSIQAVTDVESVSAMGHGTIESTGGENATKRGICWNTSGNATIADSKVEENGNFSTGAFDGNMTSLSPDTTYYPRAYAYNSAGYGYSGQVEYDTTKTSIPSGAEIIDNGDNGTTSVGSWTISGGANPYGASSLYSKDTNSTYSYENILSGNYEISLWWTEWASRSTAVTVKIYNGAALLDTKSINQQNNGGQWNVQGSYDFNATAKVVILSTGGADSTCADAVKFETTIGVDLPIVTTQAVTNIGATIAVYHGTITSLGGAANCTKRGFCWCTNPDIAPTISDNKTEENGAFDVGAFETNITDLPTDTWYYVRCYAENSAGLAYGGQVEFEAESGYSAATVSSGVSFQGCEMK